MVRYVETLNGVEVPSKGLGNPLAWLAPIIPGLLPGVTGQGAGETFTKFQQQLAAGEQQRSKLRFLAFAVGAVAVVGLGALFFMGGKKS